MNVSAWCIKNPAPAIILFLVLSVAGFMSFSSMKIQQFPDLDLPTVTVSASLPGAAPEQLENEVARKIEDSLVTLQSLKHITTKIQDGMVNVVAEFRLEKPVQEAVEDVRSAVSKIRADLPGELRDPIIDKLDLAGAPILAYAVNVKTMDQEALSWFVDDTLVRRLLKVKGVGAVNRVGGVKREIRIEINPLKLQALGITATEVSRQLKQVQQNNAGGRTDLGSGEQMVRTLGNVASVEALRPLEVSLAGGRKVRLDEIADIHDSVADIRSKAFLDGQTVVGFEVTRSRGASEVEVGAGVRQVLAEVQRDYPELELIQAFDFVKPVQEEFDGSMAMLYEGALLAIFVVWLFLRDWRATLVSSVALPLSVIPAFIGMQYLGFSINVVTLLALSLVIGILVDDAIVEVENIVRHQQMGKSAQQAAMEAADEIGLAVIATTFTLIAVFLPTAFMTGVAGRFFKQFGWTAAIAVFASLVVARMLTPMLSAYWLKDQAMHQTVDGWIMSRYRAMVAWCLQHRLLTLIASVLFFVGSVMLIPLLPKGFIPPDDMSQSQVFVELAPGATLEQTERMAEKARLLVCKVPYVERVYTTIGSGSVGSDPMSATKNVQGEVRKATLTLTLTERSQRPVIKAKIEQDIREVLTALPGVRTKVGLAASGEKFVLALSGDEPQALTTAALNLEKELRTIPGLGTIASTASLSRPEIAVQPDFARMADLGVTSQAIAETLRIATVGDYDTVLPKLNLAQRQVPVVVRLGQDGRENLEVLKRLAIPSSQPQKPAPLLSQVANIGMSSGPALITRYDRSRNINMEIELSGRPLGDVAQAVDQLPAITNLPVGVRKISLGDAEMMVELFQSFGVAMLTGVFCIFVVLILLFKDVLQPITILVALPLSFGGGFVALLLAQKSFSMPSLIGLIMLMGIATKNSILLVEYAIVARNKLGMSRYDALIDACHKRARPIIMTTIAMGAGMLPIALSFSQSDPSFRSPMAVSVIGGLVTSTLLSLLVIPVAYTYLDDVKELMERLKVRMSG